MGGGAVAACGAGGAVVVDVLEETHARVVPRRGGPACTVSRAELPADVREGDVVVDGRVDAEATARARAQVAAARRPWTVRAPAHLALDTPGALTRTGE